MVDLLWYKDFKNLYLFTLPVNILLESSPGDLRYISFAEMLTFFFRMCWRIASKWRLFEIISQSYSHKVFSIFKSTCVPSMLCGQWWKQNKNCLRYSRYTGVELFFFNFLITKIISGVHINKHTTNNFLRKCFLGGWWEKIPGFYHFLNGYATALNCKRNMNM